MAHELHAVSQYSIAKATFSDRSVQHAPGNPRLDLAGRMMMVFDAMRPIKGPAAQPSGTLSDKGERRMGFPLLDQNDV